MNTFAAQFDVVIVGAGPAGLSTALHLVARDPRWADRLVVVDKAVHPREKLCGGGLTRAGESVLERLGLGLEPAHVDVREARFRYCGQTYVVCGEPVFRVVRRSDFDHWLARCAAARGVRIREGEAVHALRLGRHGVEVLTERGVLRARTLVGADGAVGVVRRSLRWGARAQLARLLDVLTPEAESHPAFREGIALFDFSRIPAGLQGYYWAFPSRVRGRAVMNRGVFDSRVDAGRSRVALKAELERFLGEGSALERARVRGFPVRWFDARERWSRPGVLLVGEAAGVDPLFGEGIAFALAWGEVAAAALHEAFEREAFDYADYGARLAAHPVIGQLALRARIARALYGLRGARLTGACWRAAALLVRYIGWRHPDWAPVANPRLRRLPDAPAW